jgi:hypothetical protein
MERAYGDILGGLEEEGDCRMFQKEKYAESSKESLKNLDKNPTLFDDI